VSGLRHSIVLHRQRTWRYQARAGVARTPTEHAERHTNSLEFLWWINHLWQRRQKQASHLRPKPVIAHLALWLCIHKTEAGDWHNHDTGHNSHYGGLQMTSPWGRGVYYVYRADYLTASEQMRKAELGYRASGYSRSWLMGQWYHPECLAYA